MRTRGYDAHSAPPRSRQQRRRRPTSTPRDTHKEPAPRLRPAPTPTPRLRSSPEPSDGKAHGAVQRRQPTPGNVNSRVAMNGAREHDQSNRQRHGSGSHGAHNHKTRDGNRTLTPQAALKWDGDDMWDDTEALKRILEMEIAALGRNIRRTRDRLDSDLRARIEQELEDTRDIQHMYEQQTSVPKRADVSSTDPSGSPTPMPRTKAERSIRSRDASTPVGGTHPSREVRPNADVVDRDTHAHVDRPTTPTLHQRSANDGTAVTIIVHHHKYRHPCDDCREQIMRCTDATTYAYPCSQRLDQLYDAVTDERMSKGDIVHTVVNDG